MAARQIKPWMVAFTLALIGVIGATLVYRAGTRIHEDDRRAIVVWQAAASGSLRSLDASITGVQALAPTVFDGRERDPADDITRLRIALEDAREQLEDIKTPAVVEVIASAYLNAVVAATSALSSVHQYSFTSDAAARSRERAAFDVQIAEAARLRGKANDALSDLKRRFGVG